MSANCFSFWETSSPRPPTGALPLDPIGGLPPQKPLAIASSNENSWSRHCLWHVSSFGRILALLTITECLSWLSGSRLPVDCLLRRSAGTERRHQNHCATDTTVVATSATASAMNSPPTSPRCSEPSPSTADGDRWVDDDEEDVALLHSRRSGHHL